MMMMLMIDGDDECDGDAGGRAAWVLRRLCIYSFQTLSFSTKEKQLTAENFMGSF